MEKPKRKLIFGLSSYFKPTPKNIRIIGDGLLTLSTSIGSYSIAMDNKYIAISVMTIGVIGKFITNMFGTK
jgi:uncharacterized membrane protein